MSLASPSTGLASRRTPPPRRSRRVPSVVPAGVPLAVPMRVSPYPDAQAGPRRRARRRGGWGNAARGAREGARGRGAREGARGRGREVSGIRARGEGEKKGLTGAREGCRSCAVFANGAVARAGGGGRAARARGGAGARWGRVLCGGCVVRRSRKPGLRSDHRRTDVMRVRSGGPPNAMLGTLRRSQSTTVNSFAQPRGVSTMAQPWEAI